MITALIINTLVLVFCLVSIIVFVVHIAQEMTSNAPFIPISKDVLAEIIRAFDLKEGSVVYELGSGDGRVVFAIAENFPTVRVVGVERSFLPFVLSSIARRARNIKNVEFIHANFFDVSVVPATHVFLYLFPSVTNTLLPKFEKELNLGARVISCDFKFKDKEPVAVIDLHRKQYSLGSKIYVYQF